MSTSRTDRLLRVSAQQLRCFEAAARLLSVTRAAHELHVTQPTVSVQLRDLAETIGEPLFESAGRRIRLTQAGEALRETRAAKENGSLLPPKHILNAPTKLMKSEGYNDGYRYDHDEPDAFSGQDYFPEKMGRQTFYDPPERGFERDIRKRLEWWAKLRRERNG